ncbi:hypothetical protein DFH28DRAFT_91002 [Melampsora americana]|nr:hypothetical protein DFH28DRAFT_91002 [Melampsora americana]
MYPESTSQFSSSNITRNFSRGNVAMYIISATATSTTSLSKAFIPLLIQCALLHPSFAHSRFSLKTRICLTPINFLTFLNLSLQRFSAPTGPSDVFKDMCLGGFFLCMAIRSLEWGFSKGSYYTRPLVVAGGMKRWEKVKDFNEPCRKQENEPCNMFKLASWTLLQLFSLRGLQFSYGPAIAANNQSTFALVWRMFRVNIPLTAALSFLILTRDAYHGTPKSALLTLGVSDFPGLRLLSEGLHTACFGIWVACTLDNMYNILTLFATCAHKMASLSNCPQDILELCDPRYFPSILNSPHKSDSLAHFWSKGWHTVPQRLFLTIGGKPMVWIMKKLGGSERSQRLARMFGVFASSAVIHEYMAFSVARRWNPTLRISTWYPASIVYFMLQPFAILVEPLVIPLIPKRIGGGMLWVWAFGLLTAPPFQDQFLSKTKMLSDIPPLADWSLIYLFKLVK